MYDLVELVKLEDDEKKYKVVLLNTKTGTTKTIKFGQAGAGDYTIHKDDKQKEAYLRRHEGREDWTSTGVGTAGFWSRYLLWNKKTILASLNDIIERFGKNQQLKGQGDTKTYREKFNERYGYPSNASHSLEEISDLTGYALEGLKIIVKKGEGAFFSNPQSVRTHIKSAREWGMARVYSAVMNGDAARVDASHLYKN
jgi:hypothetical protein